MATSYAVQLHGRNKQKHVTIVFNQIPETTYLILDPIFFTDLYKSLCFSSSDLIYMWGFLIYLRVPYWL